MEITNIVEAGTRTQLRQWFSANHGGCKEFWIRVNRGKKDIPGVIPYYDAVLEALCFGWIDSTLKKADDGCPFQRFSPRRRNSHWTELNLRRCEDLFRQGLMTEYGIAAIPETRAANFEK